MKNKKKYLGITILLLVLIVFAINKLKPYTFISKIGNETEVTQLGSKKIVVSEHQKYEDLSEYIGTREYIFDEKNNIIYAKMKNAMGEMEFYYKIKGKKVDMYSKSIDDKEFTLEKNIDIANSPVQGILDRFNIEKTGNFVEVDKQKGSEKYKTLTNKKTANNFSEKSISKMSEEDRKKLLENLKESVENYDKFTEKNKEITILIDKKTNRVVKTIENITENSLLYYYMDGGDNRGESKPIETRVESDYYYDNIKKISLPKEFKEN